MCKFPWPLWELRDHTSHFEVHLDDSLAQFLAAVPYVVFGTLCRERFVRANFYVGLKVSWPCQYFRGSLIC